MIVCVDRKKKMTGHAGFSYLVGGGCTDNYKELKTLSEDEDPHVDTRLLVQLLEEDSPQLHTLRLNNIPLQPSLLAKIFDALKTCTNIRHLSLAGVGMKDDVGLHMVEAVKTNCTLESLNIESNQLTNESLEPLFACLETHGSMRELKCAHQKAGLGSRGEEAMVRAMERNENLLKIGYPFAVPSARSAVERCQVKNADLQRQRRMSCEHYYNYKDEMEKRDAHPQPWIKEEHETSEVRNEKMLGEIRERRSSMVKVAGSFDGRRFQAQQRAVENAKPAMDNELANALGRARKTSRCSLAHTRKMSQSY